MATCPPWNDYKTASAAFNVFNAVVPGKYGEETVPNLKHLSCSKSVSIVSEYNRFPLTSERICATLQLTCECRLRLGDACGRLDLVFRILACRLYFYIRVHLLTFFFNNMRAQLMRDHNRENEAEKSPCLCPRIA
jgi:hypothetical protein